jgi:hypothetical protein
MWWGDEVQRRVPSKVLLQSDRLDQPQQAGATAHPDVLAVVNPLVGAAVAK